MNREFDFHLTCTISMLLDVAGCVRLSAAHLLDRLAHGILILGVGLKHKLDQRLLDRQDLGELALDLWKGR